MGAYQASVNEYPNLAAGQPNDKPPRYGKEDPDAEQGQKACNTNWSRSDNSERPGVREEPKQQQPPTAMVSAEERLLALTSRQESGKHMASQDDMPRVPRRRYGHSNRERVT